MSEQSSTLYLATGGALLAGLSLGFLLGRRAARVQRQQQNGSKQRAPTPINLSYLRSTSTEGGYSGLDTPSDTPRTQSSDSLEAADSNMKMVVLVRQDLPMEASAIIKHSAWTVLGMFKKLYKRRDPQLKVWDVTGEKLDILLVPSEDEMMAVQAHARAQAIPTHTFAGRDRRRKERSVMAVGPADADTLRQLVAHLKEL